LIFSFDLLGFLFENENLTKTAYKTVNLFIKNQQVVLYRNLFLFVSDKKNEALKTSASNTLTMQLPSQASSTSPASAASALGQPVVTSYTAMGKKIQFHNEGLIFYEVSLLSKE
jgi:hypothetical protein